MARRRSVGLIGRVGLLALRRRTGGGALPAMIPPGGIGRRGPLRDRARSARLAADGPSRSSSSAARRRHVHRLRSDRPERAIRVLARRDDVAFVELACPDCGSAALGLLLPSAPDGDGGPRCRGRRPGEIGPARATHVEAISQADVAAIRDDLASWDGDLVGWLDALDRDDRRGSVVDR